MPPKRSNAKLLKKIFILLFLLVVFFLATTVYFFTRFKLDSMKSAADPPEKGTSAPRTQVVTKDVSENMIARVAAHMVLPEDEKPTVATVADPAELKGQVFFERAKKGDIVLIYTKARKAILYDPVADRIVEAAPLANEAPQ